MKASIFYTKTRKGYVVMKFIFNFLIIGLLIVPSSLSSHGQSVRSKHPNKSTEWKTYGSTITLKKASSLELLLKENSKVSDKDVLIEGTISDVCENKGCWMVIKDGKSEVRVEFKDYGFFVPWDSKGKRAKLQGRLSDKTITEAAAKHIASESKSIPKKPEEIKGEQTITVLTASAVSIMRGSDISKEQREIIDGTKEREGHKSEDHQH